jgi:hypothetical protein
MHEDELHQQIAGLVADHADQATPPPVAAIRRRGRLRRARQASGAVLLIAAVAAGLVAVQQPPGRRVTPMPVVTQPPVPLHPSAGFAAYVRDRFEHKLLDLTVVALTGGKAGGHDWQLAAVRGFNPRVAAYQECLVYKPYTPPLVHKPDSPSRDFGYKCMNQCATNKMTFDRGMDGRPLWGLVPQETTRVPCCSLGRPRSRSSR